MPCAPDFQYDPLPAAPSFQRNLPPVAPIPAPAPTQPAAEPTPTYLAPFKLLGGAARAVDEWVIRPSELPVVYLSLIYEAAVGPITGQSQGDFYDRSLRRCATYGQSGPLMRRDTPNLDAVLPHTMMLHASLERTPVGSSYCAARELVIKFINWSQT